MGEMIFSRVLRDSTPRFGRRLVGQLVGRLVCPSLLVPWKGDLTSITAPA